MFASRCRSALVVLALLAATATGVGQSRRLKVPGDHPTIQSAVTAASPGDVVEVAPGLYEESLTLGAGITLRGKSPKSTIVRGESGVPVLTIVDADKVTVERMAFEHPKSEKRRKNGDAVILVEAKGVTLRDVHVRDAEGPGVRVDGGSVAFEKIDVRRSAGAGLWVLGAEARINRSSFVFNGQGGVRVDKGAKLVAKSVSAESNKGTGIEALGADTSVELHEVTAKLNEGRGVRVADAPARIVRPQLVANELEGIRIEQCPRLDLEGGAVTGNAKNGLWLGKGTVGTVKDLRCVGNEAVGLAVLGEGTNVVVTKVTATDNKRYGILVHQAARAEVTDCVCERNTSSGISVADKGTSGTLTGNTCRENLMHGLSVTNEASATLVKNVAERNKIQGFGVFTKARAKLRRNRARDNGGNGLQVWRAGRAELEANTFDENKRSGIEVNGKGSEISLKRNRCRRNTEYGVRFAGGAAAFKVGRDNELSKNRRGRVRLR